MEMKPDLFFDPESFNVAEGKTPFERVKGLSHYRFLPPYGRNNMRSLFKYWALHWGFTDDRGKPRPVVCTRMTEDYCPVCSKVFDAMDELKRLDANGQADSAKAKELQEFKRQFESRRGYYYNAVTFDQRVVVLQVGKKTHDQLAKLIQEFYAKYRRDPSHPDQGVWFTIDRQGSGLKTEYTVGLKKIQSVVNGEEVEKNDYSPINPDLTAAIWAQLRSETLDGPLTDIHSIYEILPSATLAKIMDGAPVPGKHRAAVTPTTAPAGGTDIDDDVDMPPKAAPVPVATTVAPAPATVVAVAPPATATVTAAPASPGYDIKAEIARLQALQKSSAEKQGS